MKHEEKKRKEDKTESSSSSYLVDGARNARSPRGPEASLAFAMYYLPAGKPSGKAQTCKPLRLLYLAANMMELIPLESASFEESDAPLEETIRRRAIEQ